MKRALALLLVLLVAVAGCKKSAPEQSARLNYPKTRTVAQVDDYHGTKVPDPYRWLEDDNAPDTKAWVEAQNKLTFDYLGRLGDTRQEIYERMEELLAYERRGVPEREGENYFFTINEGLQEQSVLHVTGGKAGSGDPRVLIDPNTLSEDGTVSLRGRYPTRDGTLLAYATSKAGSDWREIRVRDVATGVDMGDHLKHIKFSGVSWTPDNYGFYYSRFPAPEEGKALTARNVNQAIYFHKLGTGQDEDVLVYERKDQPQLGVYGFCTRDGSWLVAYLYKGSSRKAAVYVQDRDKGGEVRPLFDHFEDSYGYLGNDGSVFYFLTDRNAPKRRIIAVDVNDPAPEKWVELVPETKEPIRDASIIGGRFVVQYLKLAHSKLVLHALDGTLEKEIELPTLGSVSRISGAPEHDEMYFGFTSFTYPYTVYRYDFSEGVLEPWFEPDVDFNPKRYVVKQVAYKSSKDQQYITMFLVHKKKKFKLRGQNPTLLYGYGGFNSVMSPGFSASRIVWMEMGGVFAMPNLRGGGEYGEKWHRAGMRENKQRVFDDFMDAAKSLFHNKYTSPEKLAIAGGSNGGLLVGACMTQRPDLFGACLPSVGVMDMLRFHKFTIGRAWVGEYGSSEDPEMFKVLHAYSPYHNIKKRPYPATMVTTADHDDRVVPAHSFKFAARLQAAQAGSAPILIRIETSGGHGGGTALSKVLAERADEYAFLAHALRMKLPSQFR
ncbi:MAG: prolyl oligopeptidase family serine peptidase [Planctomycetota bacterium]|jgi:prolyl oligopeptidase